MVGTLNAFSKRLADALFESIPSLEAHARVDLNPRVEPGSLLIALVPNPAAPNREFWVSTDGSEVTIGLSEFHTHFEWPDEEDDPIAFIKDLMAERTLIRITSAQGTWTGGDTVEASEVASLPPPKAGETVSIYSWSGARDVELRG
jgi:hypothetical protein